MASRVLIAALLVALAEGRAPHRPLRVSDPPDEPPEYKGYGAYVAANPLKDLPALTKMHFTGTALNYSYYNSSVADGIILDYARITGSIPIELGYGIAKSNPEVIVGAVNACGYATSKRQGLPPAVISLLYDPWIWKYSSAAAPLDDPQRNPNSTLHVADEVAFFQQKISEVVAGIDAANKQLGYNCSVGAMYFDSEFFVWPGYEAGALPTAAYWSDLGKKNEVMYNATRQALPRVPPGNIVFYARGSVHARPDLNATTCAMSRPFLAKANLPKTWCMNTDVAIETSFNSASPFSVQMAQIAEPEITRLTFENTANAASALGVAGGAVWPEYALGMGFRRVLKSMPLAPAQSPPYPLYQYSEYINPGEGDFDFGWTYDFTYSALIGALTHQKRFEASNFGSWEKATAVILYPSIFDDRGLPSRLSAGSTVALDHFIAYVRGAAGIA